MINIFDCKFCCMQNLENHMLSVRIWKLNLKEIFNYYSFLAFHNTSWAFHWFGFWREDVCVHNSMKVYPFLSKQTLQNSSSHPTSFAPGFFHFVSLHVLPEPLSGPAHTSGLLCKIQTHQIVTFFVRRNSILGWFYQSTCLRIIYAKLFSAVSTCP